jgi:hypothetical protein
MDFLVYKAPSYDTKKLLKVVFDKTALVKFKISYKFEPSIDETHSKQPKIQRKPYQRMDFKNLKKKSAYQKS